jgi:hypothetical protein
VPRGQIAGAQVAKRGAQTPGPGSHEIRHPDNSHAATALRSRKPTLHASP